jgi:enoyl-CoA hydratase
VTPNGKANMQADYRADYREILLDLDHATGVAVLTLNRPEVHNALNGSIRVEITDAVTRVARDPDIGALVLAGAGSKAFSVGADLKSPDSDHSASEFDAYLEGSARKGGWYPLLCKYPKAVIAAVNGYVAGSGLQLALTADIFVGTPSSQFWIPQVGLGLAPHVGSLIKLARIIGQQRMLNVVLTGRRITAEEALEWGLLSEIVEPDSVVRRAAEIGAQIARQPRLSVQVTKQSYFQGIDMTWDQAIQVDAWKEFCMWQTADRRERHAAFRESKAG